MFGFGKSYKEEYIELYEHLTKQWSMKSDFAEPFLNEYKKSIGKILLKEKSKMNDLENSTDPGMRLMYIANMGQEHDVSLVFQACLAYKNDLRKGKHIGTHIEKTIWAILSNRSDLVEKVDQQFARWINENQEGKFPNLFNEVFEYEQ